VTQYVILQQEAPTTDRPTGWNHVAIVEAGGAATALRVYLRRASEIDTEQAEEASELAKGFGVDLNPTESANGGTFVAIPARSFKPVQVKVETKTALKFS
jgi:hypothetical protein